MSQCVLITGAASGIGLSFVELYLKQGFHVLACARKVSPELAATSAEIIENIDVTEIDAMHKLVAAVKGRAIDILINCAGLLSNESLDDLSFERIQTQWEINALGPLRVVDALKNQLHSGAKIAMITSRMGSIADNTSGSRYGYRMSKAALNAASKSLAEDLKPQGIAVAILHPGLVATKMIGFHGDLTPDEAAQRLMLRIDEMTLATSGTFWHSNGEVLPW